MSGMRSGQLRFGCKLSSNGSALITSTILKGMGLTQSETGLVHVFVLTAGVALTLNENADPTAADDLVEAFAHLIPQTLPNAAALRVSLIGRGVTFPVVQGNAQLGTWQGVHAILYGASIGSGSGSKSRSQTKADLERRELEVLYSFVPSEVEPVTKVETAPSRGCHVISSAAWKAKEKRGSGAQPAARIVLAFCKHTSASLAWSATDSLLGKSLEASLNVYVPERWNEEFFTHTYEGPDDMPGHVKSTLIGASATFFTSSASAPGYVYLCEHRNSGGWGGGHRRKIVWLSAASSASREVEVPGVGTVDITALVEAAAAEVMAKDGLVHVSTSSGGGVVVAHDKGAADRLVSHMISSINGAKGGKGVVDTILGQSYMFPLRKGKLRLSDQESNTLKVYVVKGSRKKELDTCENVSFHISFLLDE